MTLSRRNFLRTAALATLAFPAIVRARNLNSQVQIAAIGVDYAQGYAIAMPETLDAMLQRVRADSEAAVGQLLVSYRPEHSS